MSYDAEGVRRAVRDLLVSIGEDPDREGLRQTPERMARAFAEMFSGLDEDPGAHVERVFDVGHSEMVLVRDIPLYSVCEHHLLPFHGTAHVAYIPGPEGRVTGLSKVARLVDEGTRLARDKAALTARVDALRLATRQRDGSTDLLGCPGVLGRMGDLIQVAPGWEQAVATGLGAAAEAVVATGLDDALSAVARLAEEDLGRSQVVVAGAEAGETTPLLELITAPRELTGALSRLLAGIVAVEDLPAARDAIEDAPSLIAVTRAGDRVSGWLVEGGSTARPSLLALNADLMETEEQMAQVAADSDRQRFALETARGVLQKARDEEATALAALHESDAQFTAISDALGSHRQAQAAATREADRLTSAIEAARQGRVDHETRLAELEARLVAASGEEILEPDPTNRDELAVAARLARQDHDNGTVSPSRPGELHRPVTRCQGPAASAVR